MPLLQTVEMTKILKINSGELKLHAKINSGELKLHPKINSGELKLIPKINSGELKLIPKINSEELKLIPKINSGELKLLPKINSEELILILHQVRQNSNCSSHIVTQCMGVFIDVIHSNTLLENLLSVRVIDSKDLHVNVPRYTYLSRSGFCSVDFRK